MIHFNPESHQLDVRIDHANFEGSSISSFRDEIGSLRADDVETVAVDLERVNRMDSSGLGALLDLKRQFDKAAATFSLKNVRPAVGNVIAILGAAEFLNFQSSN